VDLAVAARVRDDGGLAEAARAAELVEPDEPPALALPVADRVVHELEGAVLRRSVIGKMLLKTDCSPASSRSCGSTRICRKRSYEFFWISIRFGIGIEVLIFAKSMRSR